VTYLPSLTPKKLIRALERCGFVFDRQHGSHVILKNYERKATACVPNHNKDLKKETVKGILKQIGMTEEELKNNL
jgi:predicted RNA binding protein YcfA (HicA-like mRNA interferase family)